MDKSTLDDYVTATRHPDQDARDERQRKRLAEEERLAKLRKVAWLALAGALIGASAAAMSGHPASSGVLWGGLSATALGWLTVVLGRPRESS